MQGIDARAIISVVTEVFGSTRERWRLAGVTLLSLGAAIVETIGVAAVLPFMILIIEPASLDRFPRVLEFASGLGIESARELTIFFGIGIVVLIVCGNALSALNIFVQQKFAAHTSVRLATSMFDEYMRLPYSFHIKRDVASVLKVMTGDSGAVVSGVIKPLIVAFGRLMVTGGIAAMLFLIDPVASTVITLVLVLSYVIIFVILRKTQQTLGERTNRNNLISGRTAMETLAGVKELIVLGRERNALGEFRAAFTQMGRAKALNSSISSLPRYVLETITFSGIILVTLAMVLEDPANAQTAVPMVALYGFAAYRLLPAMQQVFAAAISIRFYMPAVRAFQADWRMLRDARHVRLSHTDRAEPEVQFRVALELRDATFSYPGSDRPALRGLDLVIRPNESIGLVGKTGAGKTTLADLILGLYEPDEGEMLVDGIQLTGSAVRAWQRRVGFVSQHVFLRNASIAENIALGIAPGDIDHAAVRRAAERAQADEFILELPNGFDSEIGAAGVRLSGGQRQRLGIARALYHEPEVLVFDEATSALDGMTEDAVMDAIEALSGERTVILIAHRLRTVEACDRIVMLDAGAIVAEGPYQELLDESPEFKRFVGRVH